MPSERLGRYYSTQSERSKPRALFRFGDSRKRHKKFPGFSQCSSVTCDDLQIRKISFGIATRKLREPRLRRLPDISFSASVHAGSCSESWTLSEGRSRVRSKGHKSHRRLFGRVGAVIIESPENPEGFRRPPRSLQRKYRDLNVYSAPHCL
jgi:hypothetical protein